MIDFTIEHRARSSNDKEEKEQMIFRQRFFIFYKDYVNKQNETFSYTYPPG